MRQKPKRMTLAVFLLLAVSSQSRAQDPFGGTGQVGPAVDPFGGGQPAADPFGAGAPAAAKPAAKPTDDEILPLEEDESSVVLAIRDMNPTTPADLMFAVQVLFDVGHTDEAKRYAQKLLGAAPNRDQLEACHREYGSAFFYRLSKDQRMKPEGEQLSKAVMEATYEASRQPARLRALVKQLGDPSPAARRRAVEDLQGAGHAAIPPILEALADSGRTAEHPHIRDALLEFGDPVVDPLLGALESPSSLLRQQIIDILGRSKATRAIPMLLGPSLRDGEDQATSQSARVALRQIVGAAATKYDAQQYLYRQAKAFQEGALAGPLDYEDHITVWRWDRDKNTVAPYRYRASAASRMMAARLARELYDLAPDNRDYRRLYLETNLADAKILNGLDQPLPQGPDTVHLAAVSAGPEAVEDVLDHAMQHGYTWAAIGAAEVLADIGNEAMLRSEDGRPRPLAMAMRHGDRRLRLAAADAIMKINPRRSYPGSSYLPETLGYLIRTVGSPRALVAHPRVGKAQTLIGMLNQLGFEADAARSGREAFRLASTNPDYEFVLFSDAVDFPNASESIQMFRKDPLTSHLPIGLMAREPNLRRAQQEADRDPRAEAFPRPHNEQGMAFQVSRLLDLAGHDLVAYDERLDQADRALDHLIKLAEGPRYRSFYDLYRQKEAVDSALFTPPLSTKAAHLMGMLGSPDAQRSLVTLASQHARPLADRQAAAKGFATAVERRGLLLSRDEILLQYERYNQSESLDSGTQQVLGSILDTIEQPSRQADAGTEAPPAADQADNTTG
jgi:hypothetical protein